jgi:RNA polymerase sigma factor (TIGR02999 family)
MPAADAAICARLCDMWTATDEAIEAAVSVLRNASVDVNDALEQMYDELRSLARARMSREQPGHTLGPTALVNEVYLVISKKYGDHFWLQDRARILATCSAVMRHFLWDHHKTRTRQKRPGSASRLSPEVLDRVGIPPEAERLIVSDLTEQGMQALRDHSPRQYQVVELRLSLNLTEEEIANVIGVHVNTVKKDWRDAKTFLKGYFSEHGAGGRSGEVQAVLESFQRLFA